MIYLIVIIGLTVIIAAGTSSNKEHVYNAEFGSENEYLSRSSGGVAVCGNKAITRQLSHTHIAIWGASGSGKSSTQIISSAVSISREKSDIVYHDVNGEIFAKTAQYHSQQGYLIVRISFTDSSKSETWNPLLDCYTVADTQNVAILILLNTGGKPSGEQFWFQSSVLLMSLLMRYLVFFRPKEERTIQNVLRLIEKFAADVNHDIDRLIAGTKDEQLIANYKALLATSEKTLQSIIISARVSLNLWLDNEICRTTSGSSFQFSMLRNPERPVAVYISTPINKLDYLKPLSALFFQFLFNHIMSKVPAKNERSIFILLDEFAVMKFPNMAITISNLRKYACSLTICMQDEMALVAQYGQAEAHQIKTNCSTCVYMPGSPHHTCIELSQRLGKTTVEIEGENGKVKEVVRELMTVDDIRLCKKAIILIHGAKPLLCDVVPYYRNFWLRKFASLPPYELPVKPIAEPVLIDFAGNGPKN